jgi:hypothetical protein
MILTATKEKEDILLRYLPLDIVYKIMNMINRMVARETRIYWRSITPKYNFIFFGFMGTNHNKLEQNSLIKRINGNFKILKDEIDEIRYLKLQNEEWAKAWNGVRF